MARTDDVTLFLRQARTSRQRSEVQLRQFSVIRAAAAKRVASRAATPSGVGPDLLDELLARDEELAAASDELREQIDALTRACSLLERERSKYVDLFEHAPDAYVVTDLGGVAQDANEAAGHLFGVEPGFLAGRPLITFVARQDTRAFRSLLKELDQTGGSGTPRALTLRMRPRGQPVFLVGARATVVRAASGRPLAVRWLLRRLDSREVERGRRGLGTELAGVLAHELSGPLAAIASWANALRDGAMGDEEEQRQALAWIEKSALAQQTFVAELAELGEVDGEPDGEGAQVVDLTERFRKTFATLPPGSERERLVLRAPPLEAAVLIRANPARLDRALELLVRRALDGTPPNAGALRACVWVDAGEAAIDIDAPESSGVPIGWEVRVALATRIAEACGARLLLSESTPSVRLRFPRAGG